MLRTPRNLLLLVVCLVVVVAVTSIIVITRASVVTVAPVKQNSGQAARISGPRNLSLQPEALRVSRRLGKRFGPSARGASVIAGTLTSASGAQALTITRQQTQTGEAVELVLPDKRLTWTDREGTKTTSRLPSVAERLLVERLTLDSPDQFVLAQLRGASYFTIARNVRPAEAQDGYSGPLWNLVRVDEPQREESLRPQSTWRIYYLNVATGLPDRVSYELDGVEISVEFLEWSEEQGEKTPAYVKWASNGQPIMEYRAARVSHHQ